MKNLRTILLISVTLLFSYGCFAQSNFELRGRCQSPNQSSYGSVTVQRNGDINFIPCPTRNVQINGSNITALSGTVNRIPFFNTTSSLSSSLLETYTPAGTNDSGLLFQTNSGVRRGVIEFYGSTIKINGDTTSTATGSANVLLGRGAGVSLTTPSENTMLGDLAGAFNITGTQNVFVGSRAGYNNVGTGNVFLGRYAGYNETGSNKLYIENSLSATPLILGDFTADQLTVNGTLQATNGFVVPTTSQCTGQSFVVTNTLVVPSTCVKGLTSKVFLSPDIAEAVYVSNKIANTSFEITCVDGACAGVTVDWFIVNPTF